MALSCDALAEPALAGAVWVAYQDSVVVFSPRRGAGTIVMGLGAPQSEREARRAHHAGETEA